jgi:hypothetical protein
VRSVGGNLIYMQPPRIKILSTAKVYVHDIFNVVSNLIEKDLTELNHDHPEYKNALST